MDTRGETTMNFHCHIKDKEQNISFVLKNNIYTKQRLRFNLKGLKPPERKIYNRIRNGLKIPYYLDDKYTTDIKRFTEWLDKPYTHTSRGIGSSFGKGLQITIFKHEEDLYRYVHSEKIVYHNIMFHNKT